MSPDNDPLAVRFAAATGILEDAPIESVVAAVQALPYGRSTGRPPAAALTSGKGTCSSKHYLLRALIEERWPDVSVQVVHRVYRLLPRDAAEFFGPHPAELVPVGGLVDVHTYLRIDRGDGMLTIDVTFPGTTRWDGHTSMRLQCGHGTDYPAGTDAVALKSELVARHCEPDVREPFIAALERATRGSSGNHG